MSRRKGLNVLCITLILALVSLIAFSGYSASEKWPTQPITISLLSAAGGGTDLAGRALASEMEKDLGVRITVVNMPGGSGGVAANYVVSKPHDGYTWMVTSEGMLGLAVLGAHDSTTKDWEYFMFGGTPAVLSVRTDSPFKSVDDVVKAMKEKPGEVKIATSTAGCIWHIKSVLFAQAADVKFKFVSYPGSNPSILAALAGEIDVVLTGLGEQSQFLEAKKLRPLAMVELKEMEVPGWGVVPPITQFIPQMEKVLPIDQWVGFAIPSDTPQDVLSIIEASFKKAVNTESVKKYAETKFVKISGLTGKESKDRAKKMESTFSWILFDLDIAQKSPDEFGIPKP